MSSVVIKSVDKDRVWEAVHSYASHLREQHPEIERIIWFGSWVSGIPTPSSDVDLCLILSASDQPPRERISQYLPLGFPLGIDLFAYTKDEFEHLKDSSPGWFKTIREGIDI